MNTDILDLTPTDDPTGHVRNHAALVAKNMLEALREKPPDTKTGQTPLLAAGLGINQYPRFSHQNPRSIIVRNFTNTTAYVYDGDPSAGSLPYITCGSRRFIIFPLYHGVKEYVVTYGPSGPATYLPGSASGSCMVDLTDQLLPVSEGPLAT